MSNSYRVILVGSAGYIAERHMRAIQATGGEIVAIVDPNDSVGVIDKYFPDAEYFKKFTQVFEKIYADYVVICTPNNTHYRLAYNALSYGYDVLIEKPIVMSVSEANILLALSTSTGRKVRTVMQLRYHPDIVNLLVNKEKITSINVSYCTLRGNWYGKSWKGNDELSGGLAMNIGIHFFDLILMLLGEPVTNIVDYHDGQSISGQLFYNDTPVTYTLSIEQGKPEKIFKVNGKNIDLLNGFENLHEAVYRDMIAGGGFGIADALPAIRLCEEIQELRGIQ